MNYLKNLLKSIIPIIIIYIIQILIIFILSSIYILLGNKNLNNFVSNELSIILSIINIFIIIILLRKYKYPNIKLNKNIYFPLVTLGISISCLFNMTLYIFIPPKVPTIPIYISIISTGVIGPFLEEILFRQILLNKLKEFNSPTKSIIISTIIFSLIHLDPIKILYTLILGLILNITYHKTNNILSSILIHISANIISIFLLEFNIYILIFSFINIIISITLLKRYIK